MATGDILGVLMQSDVGASGGVAHQAVEPSLAPEFSASGTYTVGDFVMRNGVLYICSTAHTTAAWDASHFTAVNAGTYLTMVAAANAVASGGVAPGGFGLGASAVLLTNANDLNDITSNGFYSWRDGSVNRPSNFPSDINNPACSMIVSKYTVSYVVQTVTQLSGDYVGTVMRRIRTNSTWGNWEYINPPLVAGVEYRTTERFEGKPVYHGIFKISTYTPSSVGDIWFNIPNVSYAQIIPVKYSITMVLSGTRYYVLPSTDSRRWNDGDMDHIIWPFCRIIPNSGGGLGVRQIGINLTNSEYDGTYFIADIKYTKTTD